ncbi:hypothetical protein AVEN_238711-1 [Araneus ventricosus]|uniref:Uncharacterized protein n=1 Tax=Araneus ventricosus TaxID=182803 RepID=A0A4Y2BZ03_ARAVE|nr:hypothetical protein AVEN_238711-1 [Araneus ventricosus]
MTRTTPELAPPPQGSASYQREDVWPLRMTYVQQVPYTAGLQWNWVSNLEPSGPESETLPPEHRRMLMGLKYALRKTRRGTRSVCPITEHNKNCDLNKIALITEQPMHRPLIKKVCTVIGDGPFNLAISPYLYPHGKREPAY